MGRRADSGNLVSASARAGSQLRRFRHVSSAKAASGDANPSPPGDELFSLILASVPCYEYEMDNHDPHPLSHRAESLAHPAAACRAKSSFDGTKLPVVVGEARTTSNGMNLTCRRFPTTQNRAIGQRMDSKKR